MSSNSDDFDVFKLSFRVLIISKFVYMASNDFNHNIIDKTEQSYTHSTKEILISACVLYQIIHQSCHSNHSPLVFRTLLMFVVGIHVYYLDPPATLMLTTTPFSPTLFHFATCCLHQSVLSAPTLCSLKYHLRSIILSYVY